MRWCVGALVVAMVCQGCGGEDEPLVQGVTVGYDAEARAELEGRGLGRYLGLFEPNPARTDVREDVTTYWFPDDTSGPTCLWGTPFSAHVRTRNSGKLLIYLEGGGACWSELCAAKERASAGIVPVGWTDGTAEENPFRDWDLVVGSYCDGSVFTGDSDLEVVEDGRHRTRRHHGLKNLSATIDLARKHFPSPERIVLAGSSAGGYGTLVGTAVVRLAYPNTPLAVANDAGLGFTNPALPGILEAASAEWRFLDLLPSDCEGCREGRFTMMIDWHLRHDRSLRIGGFSSFQDFVIGGAFLQMSGAEFERMLREETAVVRAAHPDRFKRYLISGGAHTAVLAGYADLDVEGVRFVDWARDLASGGPAWVDVVQGEGVSR